MITRQTLSRSVIIPIIALAGCSDTPNPYEFIGSDYDGRQFFLDSDSVEVITPIAYKDVRGATLLTRIPKVESQLLLISIDCSASRFAIVESAIVMQEARKTERRFEQGMSGEIKTDHPFNKLQERACPAK